MIAVVHSTAGSDLTSEYDVPHLWAHLITPRQG